MSRQSGRAATIIEAVGEQFSASRRQMLFGVSLGALFAAAGGTAAMPARVFPVRSASVISFHRDEPWIDPSGRADPFYPPQGLRGGAVPADLSDATLRCLDCYL